MDYRYTMPQGFMEDKSVPVKWRLYGIVNGFWLSGRSCYGGNPYFAKELGVSERQIRNAFAELEADKLLRRNIKGTTRIVVPYSLITLEAEVGVPPGGSGSSGEAEVGVPHISDSISDSITSAFEDERREVPDIEEESTRVKKPPKYPNARTVFSWFPEPQLSWRENVTECKHAEMLFLRGEQKVKSALAYVARHKADEYFYKITKPSELERKWLDLVNHKPV